MCLQLAAIGGFGALSVAESPVLGPVDEGAHLSYVEFVAEKHRTPIIYEPISPELAAIADGTWPRVVEVDPRRGGLAGTSYEGFHPPLYYVIAAPVFLLAGDHMDKLYALRAFDLLLLLGAAALLWRFARSVFGERHRALLGYSIALNALLLPGVVVRSVQVSNTALEIFMATAVLWQLWVAHRSRSDRRLVAAGGLLGLALLTKLTLVWLVPIFLAFVVDRLRRELRAGLRTAAMACLLPLLLLSPWLALNQHRYGSLTPNAQAREQQRSTVNPTGYDYGIADLPERNLHIIDVVDAQEWLPPFGIGYDSVVGVAWKGGMWLALLVVAVALPRWLGWAGRAVLLAPLGLALIVLNVTVVQEDWNVLLPRYLYPALPALGLAAAATLERLAPRGRVQAAVAAALPLALIAAWSSHAIENY